MTHPENIIPYLTSLNDDYDYLYEYLDFWAIIVIGVENQEGKLFSNITARNRYFSQWKIQNK